MFETVSSILTVNQWELVIVGGLSAVAGYMLKEALSSALIASIFFPFFLFSGLISRYIFLESGLFLTSNPDTDLILATSAGLVIALIGLTIAMRLYVLSASIKTRADVRRQITQPRA